MLVCGQMKKADLIKELSRTSKIETGAAADHIDRTVTRILRTLRAGKPAHLPGLGTITPGKEWGFLPDHHDH
jgi:nucleoid DNA-binding protein